MCPTGGSMPFWDADKAFELGAHPTDDVVKIVVKMS